MAHDGAVARRDPGSIKSLLPQVLGNLARDSGRARHLAAVWEDAVGSFIAQNAQPQRLEDGELILSVTSARWAHELQARAEELCGRLSAKLGEGLVTRLTFRMGAGDRG